MVPPITIIAERERFATGQAVAQCMAFAIDMITSTFCGPKNSAGDVTPRKAIHGQIHAKVRAALLAAKASPDLRYAAYARSCYAIVRVYSRWR